MKLRKRMINKLPKKDRRGSGQRAKDKLHKLSPTALDKALKSERRFDEYVRLREIRQQNAMWYRTVAVSIALNVMLLVFAYIGTRG